MRVFASWINDR